MMGIFLHQKATHLWAVFKRKLMNDINGVLKVMVKDLISSEIEALKVIPVDIQQDSKLYSEAEAASYLKRSKTTMWRLRRDGAISFTKYGRKIVYTEDDLNQFLNSNRVDRL